MSKKLINALIISIYGDWSYLVSKIGLASSKVLAKKLINKKVADIAKIDIERMKASFILVL